MNGFLGTGAPLLSDISLIISISLVIIASFGGIQAHRKRFSTHCPVMAITAFLNWIPIIITMIPIWFRFVLGNPLFQGGLYTNILFIHGVLGGITQLIMMYTVTRMYWVPSLPPKKPIWLMRITISLWFLVVLGGIGGYLLLYVL